MTNEGLHCGKLVKGNIMRPLAALIRKVMGPAVTQISRIFRGLHGKIYVDV